MLVKHIPTPGAAKIIYDTDPERLVEQVIAALDVKFAVDPIGDDVPIEHAPVSKNRRG